MAFNSKYTGQEVEELLDKVNEGGGGTDLQYYSENTSAGTATINAPNEVDIIDGDGNGIYNGSGSTAISNPNVRINGSSSVQISGANVMLMGNDLDVSFSDKVRITGNPATYNGNEIATTEDLEGKQDKLNYYSESTTSKSAFIDSDSIFLTATDKAYYNNKEIATVDMVDTALTTLKAALPSDTLLGFLDSWFSSGKDYITSAEIVDYTEDTSMVRIRFTCEGYADEGTRYFVLSLEDGGNMPITTERGNTGTSEGYLVYGVFDIVVKLTYQMSIYNFSEINQKYTLELSDKITDLVSLQKAYPSSTLVSMVGSYWINQLSSHTQNTTIKIMDYDSETNSVRLRFYGRVTSNVQGLAIYESSSAKYLIQYVPRTATNYHVVFDLVVPFVNGEFLPFSTLLHVVDYV